MSLGRVSRLAGSESPVCGARAGPLADEEGQLGSDLTVASEVVRGGWLGITWPREYGGRGGTFLQETICDQELERRGLACPSPGLVSGCLARP